MARLMSTRATSFTCSRTPRVSKRLKPCASAVRLYTPMGTARIVYWPSESVVVWNRAPVPSLIADTVMDGTTLPDGSLTTPAIEPVTFCEKARPAPKNDKSKGRNKAAHCRFHANLLDLALKCIPPETGILKIADCEEIV